MKKLQILIKAICIRSTNKALFNYTCVAWRIKTLPCEGFRMDIELKISSKIFFSVPGSQFTVSFPVLLFSTVFSPQHTRYSNTLSGGGIGFKCGSGSSSRILVIQKFTSEEKKFFLFKNCNLLFPRFPLKTSQLGYRRSLQPSKKNIQYWIFLLFILF